MRFGRYLIFGGAAVALTLSAALAGVPEEPATAAQYNDKGELLFPAAYRSWTFVTSGHAMSYNKAANATSPEGPFDNVFVNPEAHAAFLKTGHWPEGTVLVLEIRGSTSKGSINKSGAFQSGAPLAVEVHVRDSKRFKGGWGFFGFDGQKPAAMIGYDASCYACHQANAAVDTTFVQFYPTLLPVATAHATLSDSYLANEKAARP